MFGYIRPVVPELKIREYRYYRGIYCGMCRAQGRCTGQCSRMTLSYDFVFLAMVRLAMRNGNPDRDAQPRSVKFEQRRCLPHPFRKRLSLERGEVTDYVACCAAILNYHKLNDDRVDERGKRRMRAILMLPTLRRIYGRARRRYPALAQEIASAMQAFGAIETEKTESADRPAAAFGEVLAVMFSHGLEENKRRIAWHIGFHIGKWLYFADAVDDFSDDVRCGRFNPLRCLYGDEPLSEDRKQALLVAMTTELIGANDALALLDYEDESCQGELRALLQHMLMMALPQATHTLVCDEKTADSKKRK